MTKIRKTALMLGLMLVAFSSCGNAQQNTEGVTSESQAVENGTSESQSAEGGTSESKGADDETSESRGAEDVTSESESTENVTSESQAPEGQTTETAAQPSGQETKEPHVSFSGNAEDVIEIQEDSYYEGEEYYLFLKKGAKLRGDVPQKIERIMKEEEELFHLSYKDGKVQGRLEPWRSEIFGGKFYDINTDNSKVNILIIPDPQTGEIPWSDSGAIMLFSEEFEQDDGTFDVVYHELAHVLRLRMGPFLGQTFEEGVGLYAQDRISRLENYPTWTMIQYCDSNGFEPRYDSSLITADPEGEFRRVTALPRSAEQEHYQYGVRFITFLMQTYGQDAVAKATEVSTKYMIAEDDVDTFVSVIKEAFGDDVFTKFGEWVPAGWKAWCDDYCTYMKPFGLE